jgi:hypothetical protein
MVLILLLLRLTVSLTSASASSSSKSNLNKSSIKLITQLCTLGRRQQTGDRTFDTLAFIEEVEEVVSKSKLSSSLPLKKAENECIRDKIFSIWAEGMFGSGPTIDKPLAKIFTQFLEMGKLSDPKTLNLATQEKKNNKLSVHEEYEKRVSRRTRSITKLSSASAFHHS